MRRAFCLGLLAGAAMAQVQLTSPPAQPGTPDAQTPAGTGAIEGVVTDAATHAPVGKAQVTISGAIAARLTAVTGGDGRFALRALGPGSYWLNAAKGGYNPPQGLDGPATNAGVVLGNGEERKGVEIALLPGGEISGRVVDEEGVAVRSCTVTAVQPGYERNRRTLVSIAGGTPTDNKGAYRMVNLAAGRYYLFGHCQAELPAAHGLLPRGDPRTPHETYLPQFYGGGLDPAMATRLTVTPGAPLQNVDFRMTRAPSWTVRGSVGWTDAELLAGNISVLLWPANPLLRGLLPASGTVDPKDRGFQIQPVLPGSYVLLAFSMRDRRTCATQRALEVAAAAPNPLELTLDCGAELKGSVQFDSADHVPFEHLQISLLSLDGPVFMPQPQAAVDKEGGFSFSGVTTGKWRLMVNAPGFLKSVTLAGETVSPDGFQLTAGTAGPLHVVMSTKMADVKVEIAGVAPDRQVSALIFPEDLSRLGAGVERAGMALGTGTVDFGGMPPGRYRVLATDCPNPWVIVQRPDWLAALIGHSAAMEVPESGRIATTVEIMPRDELTRVLGEIE